MACLCIYVCLPACLRSWWIMFCHFHARTGDAFVHTHTQLACISSFYDLVFFFDLARRYVCCMWCISCCVWREASCALTCDGATAGPSDPQPADFHPLACTRTYTRTHTCAHMCARAHTQRAAARKTHTGVGEGAKVSRSCDGPNFGGDGRDWRHCRRAQAEVPRCCLERRGGAWEGGRDGVGRERETEEDHQTDREKDTETGTD